MLLDNPSGQQRAWRVFVPWPHHCFAVDITLRVIFNVCAKLCRSTLSRGLAERIELHSRFAVVRRLCDRAANTQPFRPSLA